MHYFDSTKSRFWICDEAGATVIIPTDLIGKKLFICALDDMKSLKELNTNEEPD